MGTKPILERRSCLVFCRLSVKAIGLSVHPNNTPVPIERMNLKLEPNKLPGGSILYMGEEGSPTLPAKIFDCFDFSTLFPISFGNLHTLYKHCNDKCQHINYEC